MKSLEQERAGRAIGPAKELEKQAVNKLPALIVNNGLLATISFCLSEGGGDNRGGMKRAMQETALHLEKRKIVGANGGDLEALIRDLTSRSSFELQEASQEALQFIGYLRRFAPKKEDGDGNR